MKPNIYFIGAGGIGMANLVRYCLSKGHKVAGYDRTPSVLTTALEAEGAVLTFIPSESEIPKTHRNPDNTLVVYTPAVPQDNAIMQWFRQGGFEMVKRAELLGQLTRPTEAICVAGSHGKTTTSSMISLIMHFSTQGCNAFLGGILRNTGSNLILNPTSKWSVVEADEYDRSFHWLSPTLAVITSTDPDHLDIYGDEEHYLEAFAKFTSLIRPGGLLILHSGLKMEPSVAPGVRIVTYTGKTNENAEIRAENVRCADGRMWFDYVAPDRRINALELGVPVEINVDNAVAAVAASIAAGAEEDAIRRGLAEFLGAKRRFEIHLRGDENPSHTALIDDYAHSPNEIKASIASVRRLYPGRKLTVIFQPHLYTRTRDFADGFAEALSAADEVIMPEIYPAREAPIPGVDSALILNRVTAPQKRLCPRKDLLDLIKNTNFEVLMTLGAADIDTLLPEIKEVIENKAH